MPFTMLSLPHCLRYKVSVTSTIWDLYYRKSYSAISFLSWIFFKPPYSFRFIRNVRPMFDSTMIVSRLYLLQKPEISYILELKARTINNQSISFWHLLLCRLAFSQRQVMGLWWGFGCLTATDSLVFSYSYSGILAVKYRSFVEFSAFSSLCFFKPLSFWYSFLMFSILYDLQKVLVSLASQPLIIVSRLWLVKPPDFLHYF